MDLKSGYPFWPVKNGLPVVFPAIERDERCDVLVVGAGITGALIAHSLSEAGLDVVVVDRRDAGWGSTSASTALLQYEIDTELTELCELYGEAPSVAVYRACEEAIGIVGEIAAKFPAAGFRTMQSLYYASRRGHAQRVRDEGALRQRHGFELEVLEREALRERFDIRAPAALLTKVAAQIDPYRFTLELLHSLAQRGVRVYDRTTVERWRERRGECVVKTDRDAEIHCDHVVLAAGYESQKFLRQRVASNHSSFAFVSEPLAEGERRWLNDTVVWESARPYLYMRTTQDGRVLAGGEDSPIDWPGKREIAIAPKVRKIARKVKKLLPWLPLEEGFSWAGTFAETEDGLPFFGPHAQHGPRFHFAMAYGGNGIVYSAIGADLITRRILREAHPLMKFLSFDRVKK